MLLLVGCDARAHGKGHFREEFNDVEANEIESNWDQVVDKYDLKCLLTLYMRLKCTCLT